MTSVPSTLYFKDSCTNDEINATSVNIRGLSGISPAIVKITRMVCVQLWATSDWKLRHDNAPTHAWYLEQSFFDKTSNHPGNPAPPWTPAFAPSNFWLFPKLKSPLKGKSYQTIDEIQENATGQLMAIGRTVWGPKVPTLKRIEASLSYIQCFL